MRAKRIGIDIDNCLTKIDYVLEVMADYYGKPVPQLEDITDYNLSSVFGVSEADSREFWENTEAELIKNAVPQRGVLDHILATHTDDETEIYIITNRDYKYYDITHKWLRDNGIPFLLLIHTSGESKRDIINKLRLDIMVDDKPSLFEEMRLGNTRMVCVDYAYNRHVPCYRRISPFVKMEQVAVRTLSTQAEGRIAGFVKGY